MVEVEKGFREDARLLKNSFVPDSGPRFDVKNAHSEAFRAQFGTVNRPNTDFFNSLTPSRKPVCPMVLSSCGV